MEHDHDHDHTHIHSGGSCGSSGILGGAGAGFLGGILGGLLFGEGGFGRRGGWGGEGGGARREIDREFADQTRYESLQRQIADIDDDAEQRETRHEIEELEECCCENGKSITALRGEIALTACKLENTIDKQACRTDAKIAEVKCEIKECCCKIEQMFKDERLRESEAKNHALEEKVERMQVDARFAKLSDQIEDTNRGNRYKKLESDEFVERVAFAVAKVLECGRCGDRRGECRSEGGK